MKRILTFIPLGVGISSALIYIFNVIQFRVINNSATLLQILSTLKIYLFISIIGFVVYFLIRFLSILESKKVTEQKQVTSIPVQSDACEPLEIVKNENVVSDYNALDDNKIPFYDTMNINIPKENLQNNVINETKAEDKMLKKGKYCFNCGNEVDSYSRFCSYCGTKLISDKKRINPILRNIINVIEIVILLLIIYFSLTMLFDYKESKDPNFNSPFKISMTK